MILVVDFGSQTAHLILRRIKELGAFSKIIYPQEAIPQIHKNRKDIDGIILSGGPASVYQKNAPAIDPEIFNLKIPILGICYGFQLTAKLLKGKVISGKKEYGPAQLEISNSKSQITKNIPQKLTVWMSHGDEVVKLPEGFKVLGSSEHVPFAFVDDKKRKIFGLQFHPEVEHTDFGRRIIKNFLNICGARFIKSSVNVKRIEKEIADKVKKSYVIGAVSGGVDSTVASVLTANAIGEKFIPVFVDNGLMREGTKEHLKKIFDHIGIKLAVVKVEKKMLRKLRKVEDSEKKREIIGNYYIEIFEKEMKKLVKKGKKVVFLLQGTIYSDVIESKGTRYADKIKSHHNVGGLPKKMKLKLLEPMREFYKDEVRDIGRKLNLPESFINMQPFPGPGFAVRIRGEVTKKRLKNEKKADRIVLEELKKTNLLSKVFLSFPVMTNAFSTAVKGDGRVFGEVIALRIIESKDVMTSTWAKIPYEVLQRISSRIVNEVPEISRVVYDITTKPPATMEWE
ncbi:MAG: hypothetical protein A3C97_01865 [Candidatus Levybacteria bacterium RIFCSPHIGHO2_02_FULL_37_11]|nr:MAG: hypothetical protein A3C97_01865 [Candidatus Levybacteria bacterium RIFCSPHIGHO2_02_FULL_37_11]